MGKQLHVKEIVIPKSRVYCRGNVHLIKLPIDISQYVDINKELKFYVKINNMFIPIGNRKVWYDKALRGYVISLPVQLNELWSQLKGKEVDVVVRVD